MFNISWGTILFILSIYQIYSNFKKDKSNSKKIKKKKKVVVDNKQKNYKTSNDISKTIDMVEKRPNRKIFVDKERQILKDNDYTISSSQLINDIIFSEILKKPKSKR